LSESGTLYGGRYEVSAPIASGGMAEVFLARDRLLGRQVALKVLHPEYARDRAFIERFRREAQAAASLNDPKVVSIYDWGSEDGTHYIVMEYVQGRSLKELIQREGPLGLQRALEVAADVCTALRLAHRQGIIHRDVKSANIMVTPARETKVMDFGIARATLDEGGTVTQTGMVIGTASYLSPEQAQGLAVDARSDIYSVGVVLYEMLTGEVPFKGDTPVSIAYKHVKVDPTPPSRLNPKVPAEVDAVVMKALAKNPDNRYQSAEEMRQDLQRVLAGQPVHATPLLPADRTTSMRAVADQTTVLPPTPTYPGPAYPPPAGASAGRKGLMYALLFLLFLSIVVGAGALVFRVFSQGSETVEVPRVEGKPLDLARRELEAAQLIVVADRREPSDTVPPDHVIEQNPEDGRKVSPGSRIELVISSGPDQVVVPDVRGKTREEAQRILEEARLKANPPRTEFSADVEAGRVIKQDPSPGERVDPGRSVDLTVSAGKDTVDVPDVTGIDEEGARRLLVGAGLRMVSQDACEVSKRSDIVLSQSPAPGEKVGKDSEVTIRVNRVRTVPNVVGMTEAEATQTLQAAGFKVESKPRDENGPAISFRSGKVVRQDPKSGASSCPGDTVTITVD
jgi:beta-lactam-binding protein with PASTA domain/tRNA A-37 threonylcarbamoyl transferase component Bud32